ncbi:hypothetical protein NQ315_003089 [Exocentrus adspersus]|uniref:MADF domain-containing protein n=1 Tax=Exocentrus adspersus TaxID=1586481 RepID=A0AAV8W5R4_9CUCU|nr:hypothetical protein NQ315_003089 [Exocentrus adspersus]
MEWSREAVLSFIDAYRRQPCIWDPRHSKHKDRVAVATAWKNIQAQLNFKNCTVDELKKKRNSLMASFRMLTNKKKKKKESDQGTEEAAFEPQWFAYETMQKFLGPIYNRQGQGQGSPKSETIITFEDVEADCYEYDGVESFKLEDISSNDTFGTYVDEEEIPSDDWVSATRPPLESQKVQTTPATEEEETHSNGQVLNPKRKVADEEVDDCALYAQLLAKKLRKFSSDQREEIMFEIDGLLIRKRKSFSNAPAASKLKIQ